MKTERKEKQKMSLAKKCDRCGKLYEHYPKGNKVQSNAIRKIQRNSFGGTTNAYDDWIMDLCQECMSEFDKFMMKGKSSDEK